MEEPLVSVIVPIYNVSQFLRKCLDSIIGQTYKNLEIILVDDGSTDDSGKICDEYEKNDLRIKVIHQNNKGQASARNEAFKVSNGDYLLYVDSDDYIKYNHIETLMSVALEYDADIVHCQMMEFSDERKIKNTLHKISQTEKQIYNACSALKEYSYQRIFLPAPWCKLIKSELMNGLQFPVGIGYEDMAVMYKVIGRADRLVFIPEISYYYRQHRNSTMHAEYSDKKIDRIKIAEQFLEYIKTNYPEDITSAYTRYSLAQLQLLMELPFGKEYKNIRDKAFNNLLVSRTKMLHDNKSPFRLKIMVAASYLGPTVLMCLGKIYIKVTKR